MMIKPDQDMPEGFDPRKRPWYTSCIDQTIDVSAPYVDAYTGDVTITISKAVFNNGKKTGVVGIDLNLGILSTQINNMKIGETGSVFALYKNGDTIIHKNTDFLGKDLTGKYKFIGEILRMKNGMLDYELNGENFSVVRTLDEYGWTLAGTIGYSEIWNKINSIRNFILALFAFMVLLILAAAWLLSRSISAPIIRGWTWPRPWQKGI